MEEKIWNTAFFLTPFNSKIKNVDSEANINEKGALKKEQNLSFA